MCAYVCVRDGMRAFESVSVNACVRSCVRVLVHAFSYACVHPFDRARGRTPSGLSKLSTSVNRVDHKHTAIVENICTITFQGSRD